MRFNGVLFPIETPRVTMPFKATETKWYSEAKPHRGVDISPFPGAVGAPVRMPLHGTVIYVGEHTYAGREIVTRHVAPFDFGATTLSGAVLTTAEGTIFHFRSTHHSAILVSEGEEVAAGQVIAHVGNTGAYTTGPHVHLELHVGGKYPDTVVDAIDFFIAAIPGLRDAIVRPW